MAERSINASVGEILTETFAIVRRQLVPLGVGAVLVSAIQSIIDALGNDWASLIATFVLTILFSYLALELLLRREGLLSQSWQGRRFGAYILLAIIAGIAIGFGIFLLIVPGLILIARWSLATPYVVGESLSSTDALDKSWEATSGSQWAIVGVTVIFFVAFFALVMGAGGFAVVTAMPIADLTDPTMIAIGFVWNIVSYVYSGVNLASTTALYRLLSVRPNEIEAIFS